MKPFFLAVPVVCALTWAAPAATAKSWVQLSTQLSATQYAQGQPIDVILRAKNSHSRPAFLKFSSGQRFELQLFDANPKTRIRQSEPVYTWSATRSFLQSLGQLSLASKATQTFRAQIGDEMGQLSPGRYELRARLTNSSNIAAAPVTFQVVAAPATDQPKEAPAYAAPISFAASTDKTSYTRGETVKVAMSATNTSAEPQTLNFRSGQSFDVTVARADGTPVWSWGANKRFMMSLRDVVLAPGEKKTWDATWNGETLGEGQITPGTYSVQAVLTSNPRIEAGAVKIEIK